MAFDLSAMPRFFVNKIFGGIKMKSKYLFSILVVLLATNEVHAQTEKELGYRESGRWVVEGSSAASTFLEPQRPVEYSGRFLVQCYSSNGNGDAGVRYEASLSTVEMPEARELLKNGKRYKITAFLNTKQGEERFSLPHSFEVIDGPEGRDPMFQIDLGGVSANIRGQNAAFLKAIATATDFKLVFASSKKRYVFIVPTNGSSRAIRSLYCARGVI